MPFARREASVYTQTMEFLQTVITSGIFWGFIGGLVLCLLSIFSHLKTKKELKRMKTHLSDKLEIEAEKMTEMKGSIDTLKTENENLRMKINSGRAQSDVQSLERELEIFARAEKSMVVNAPGFAQAWDKAKEHALEELEAEEAGKSLPRRIFNKFFSKGHRPEEIEAEVVEALPGESEKN